MKTATKKTGTKSTTRRATTTRVKTATKRFSIAEARKGLPGLVHRVEAGGAIEITRRGEPVAVLVSVDEYARLAEASPSFWDRIVAFRKRWQVEKHGFGRDEAITRRDRSLPREFRW